MDGRRPWHREVRGDRTRPTGRLIPPRYLSAMYVDCSCGHRHWGTHGAAGLLLTDPDRTGVVLQHRSAAVHQGDTWSVMGGALDAGESPVDAALREAHEEAGLDPDQVVVRGTVVGMQHPE